MLLAGDIGGTKTRLAAISPGKGPHDPLYEKTFQSGSFPSLEAVVEAFFGEVEYTFTHASFGVAGPIVDGRAKVTNLPWVMEEAHLAEELALEQVTLLNDLQATAYGVLSLRDDEKHTLNTGKAIPHAAISVIAPGTGLGEAFLTWDGSRYIAHPSEGGHTDFGPLNKEEAELLLYLLESMDHVSYEWVCSGIGIPNIYNFLRDTGYAAEPDWFAEELAAATDKTPLISQAAFEREDPLPLCVKTMEMFVNILGAEAGNLALKTLSTGGVYVGGGIPPRILPALEKQFMSAFLTKGRFNDLLRSVPVNVILNHKTALLGAATHVIDYEE